MQFTEMQLDLLKEAFNIGVGQAAFALSELAGNEEILLSVPEVSVKTVSHLLAEIVGESGEQVCGICETFGGLFPGKAMLLYSEEESLELVREMLSETVPVELMSEMEGEALCEVGNIVLNACISSLANLLEGEITTEVPTMSIGTPEMVLKQSLGEGERPLLHLRMFFDYAPKELSGRIGFMLELPSAERLIEQLDNYYQKNMA